MINSSFVFSRQPTRRLWCEDSGLITGLQPSLSHKRGQQSKDEAQLAFLSNPSGFHQQPRLWVYVGVCAHTHTHTPRVLIGWQVADMQS